MTHIALKISEQFTAALVEHIHDGRLRPPLPPGPRDGLAALACWQSAGRPVERITPDDLMPIPPDLRLDLWPIARMGVGYRLLRTSGDWIIVARIAAKQTVAVIRDIGYAYPDPMLVYCGWRAERRSIFTGCVNLAHHPNVAGLRLAPGANYGEMGSTPLDQATADDDLLAVGMCLPRFYGLVK